MSTTTKGATQVHNQSGETPDAPRSPKLTSTCQACQTERTQSYGDAIGRCYFRCVHPCENAWIVYTLADGSIIGQEAWSRYFM